VQIETGSAEHVRPSLEVSLAVLVVSIWSSATPQMEIVGRTEKYCCCEGSAFGGPGGMFAGLRRRREGRLYVHSTAKSKQF
jgi:hypothetical protein